MHTINMLDLYSLAGLVGLIVYIGSYAALQLGFLRGHGYAYASLNAAGAGLVLLSLRESFNLSSALIQVCWIVISVVGIVRYYLLTRRSQFTPEEREFLDATMPDLEPARARQLLDLGSWHSAEDGERLTAAGEHSASLYYLLNGGGRVSVDGHVIAHLDDHTFIGEMGAVQGVAASATVELDRNARYLSLPVQALQRLMHRNLEVRTHLNAALWSHVADKLVRTNQDLARARSLASAET